MPTAHKLGLIHKISQPSRLIDDAIDTATELPESARPAFAIVKHDLVSPVIAHVHAHAAASMERALDLLFSDQGFAHITNVVRSLKKKK